jgi:adenine C2-methylase RlmN of 23S rRNA A2503 and tRNA A37
MNGIIESLKAEGYDYAVAIATQAEIKAGAACGQLAIISEASNRKSI